MHTWATDTDDGTVDPIFGKVGKQKIENTGPLAVERMKTIDDEFTDAALGWIDKQAKANKPFFCYYNSTRMHVFTHLKKESEGKTGLGLYPDGMVEHDAHVGQLLKKLDELGIADNTIVVYTTDNGAEVITWPDGGTTPFNGEKATNWEGGFRVPTLIRWPGVIKPNTIINDLCAHEDLIPTFAAAAGEPDLVAKVMKGYEANGKTFKVHLDGYNLMPFLKGDVKESPRKEFIYWSDDGDLMAIRYEQWKSTFLEQNAESPPKHRSACGRASSPSCALPTCTTCAPTRSSAARRASTTATGWPTACSYRSRCRRSPPSGWRASRSSRRVRNPRASTSTR